MSALNYQQERKLQLKAFMDSLQKQPDWTFATLKQKGGSCVLLAKKKYSCDRYRFVTMDNKILVFRTKASAHNVAKYICEQGLENSGYELGNDYEG